LIARIYYGKLGRTFAYLVADVGIDLNDAVGRIHVREVKAPQSREETARRGRSTVIFGKIWRSAT
jgi:hypothetical protein